MKCERCGKNEANIHMKNFINGKVTELNICDECAKSEEIGLKDFSLETLVSDLVENFTNTDGFKSKEEDLKVIKRCEKCGMDYSEFRSTGYLGCDNCYSVYGKELRNILKNMNGSSEHKGKMPKRLAFKVEDLSEIEKKELELNKAVEEENYERAACLRDEIKILKQSRKED
ncbi:MAG: UvrB/UvrC motif-containing protein [Andreesenia angusta]|nr:UvrB/UvrC motif-containing protein [Andreesenia angusta]